MNKSCPFIFLELIITWNITLLCRIGLHLYPCMTMIDRVAHVSLLHNYPVITYWSSKWLNFSYTNWTDCWFVSMKTWRSFDWGSRNAISRLETEVIRSAGWRTEVEVIRLRWSHGGIVLKIIRIANQRYANNYNIEQGSFVTPCSEEITRPAWRNFYLWSFPAGRKQNSKSQRTWG